MRLYLASRVSTLPPYQRMKPSCGHTDKATRLYLAIQGVALMSTTRLLFPISKSAGNYVVSHASKSSEFMFVITDTVHLVIGTHFKLLVLGTEVG